MSHDTSGQHAQKSAAGLPGIQVGLAMGWREEALWELSLVRSVSFLNGSLRTE